MYYVAHRLFAAHDRALGAAAARSLAAKVGADNVFLPFCDTDEEDLVAQVKGRRLYELDTQRIPRLDGMIAILHGPSLDDGVCMEIGYATALGVPVIALTTDFTTHAATDTGRGFPFPDPLVETVATATVRAERLGPPDGAYTDRFARYERRNRDQVHAVLDQAADLAIAAARLRQPEVCAEAGNTVVIEPSPYHRDYDWRPVVDLLEARGKQVLFSERHSSANPTEAAKRDWDALAEAGLLLCDLSGPEAPPGAALMIGALVATGRPAYGRCPAATWTFAQGREPNWRNLMIQYAVAGRFADSDELEGLLP